MNSNQKLFLVLSLISIFILLLVSQFIQPQITNASDISSDNLNQLVKLNGKIISQKNYEGKDFQVLIFRDDSGKIEVTTNAKQKLELNYSKNYTIIGKVSEYNQTIQISANKILSLN
ncbi:MAG: hypothetical protein Q8L27_03675 [archaeon]|nr:hypothetical protein [archaeon]